MTDTAAPAAMPETKSFSGSYLLFRRDGQGLRRAGGSGAHQEAKVNQVRSPRFRYSTFAAAETEAHRLLVMLPKSTFIIIQEVARVKLRVLERDDG